MTEPTDAELLAEWDRVSHIADAGQRRLACLRAALAKWGTPQPVVREPLTDEQWQRITDLTGGRILTQGVKDEIERVIGIKGGQHGTDT